MDKQEFKNFLSDLRLLVLFPKRYGVRGTRGPEFWRNAVQSYGDFCKRLEESAFAWRVITYDDGHEELARLRVLKGGMFSGKYPAVYRGAVIPRRITLETWARIKEIRVAF